PRQNVAEITIGLAGAVVSLAKNFSVMLVDAPCSPFATIPPDIAYGQHLHLIESRIAARHISPGAAEQMTAALAAAADKTHRDPLAGRDCSSPAQSRRRDERGPS